MPTGSRRPQLRLERPGREPLTEWSARPGLPASPVPGGDSYSVR